jgi:hypothetical protein
MQTVVPKRKLWQPDERGDAFPAFALSRYALLVRLRCGHAIHYVSYRETSLSHAIPRSLPIFRAVAGAKTDFRQSSAIQNVRQETKSGFNRCVVDNQRQRVFSLAFHQLQDFFFDFPVLQPAAR